MTAHLTNEELTNSLLDERSMTVDAHLLDCGICRAELNRLRTSVAVFRTAAQSWSENAVGKNAVTVAPRRDKAWGAEWVVAAGFLLVLVVMPILYWQDHRSHTQTGSTHALATEVFQVQVNQDNELLSAVNREIAEGVPAPMQPLQVSFSFGTASSANPAK